jgi:hypothetical protein
MSQGMKIQLTLVILNLDFGYFTICLYHFCTFVVNLEQLDIGHFGFDIPFQKSPGL